MNILRKIHKINNPKDTEGYNVTKVMEDVEFIDSPTREMKNVSENPFVMLWKQTYILFSGNNARKMIIVCLMQCGLFASCHGLYMFFPQIVDQLASYSNQFPAERSTMCEILTLVEELAANVTEIGNMTDSSEHVQTCSETYEVSTFFYSLILELLYMFGFLVITFIINRTSKLNVLLVILFGCSISGFGTLFSTIPLLSVYLYVIFMGLLLAVNIVNSATVDLFPTNLR